MIKKSGIYLSVAIALLTLGFTALPVYSQEQQQETSERETGLETIVVTAERRAENLQEVQLVHLQQAPLKGGK
jgi:outer membrane cobalamin receptor